MGGYFKVWRKIEDSSRAEGALRGLMITFSRRRTGSKDTFTGRNPAGSACLFRGFAGERA
ncbi:MAG: hypothetical protein ACLR0N_17890 [Bilophila wadsworthia]